MAIYTSTAYNKGGRERPNGEDNGNKLTATVTIPAGVNLAPGDILKFGRIGETVRVTQFQLEFDQFDSNAAATLAGRSGITASDGCFTAAGVVQTNTTGRRVIARVDGEGTAIDSFAVTPFPVQGTVQELLFTVTAAAATPVNLVARNVTGRFEYDYVFPAQTLVGVSAGNYPFGGTTVNAPATLDTYYGNAP